ncbi:MAG: ABC transporter ATP-binding protein [Clostridia bacterium]|nr:ABC transporter ATP-binding protein [Clostridia bacterium]
MKRENRIRIACRLIKILDRRRFAIVPAVLCGLMSALCEGLIPAVGAWGLAAICTKNGHFHIGPFFGILAVLGILRGIFRYGETAISSRIAYNGMAMLRNRIFTALRKLAPAKLSGKNRGDLITVIMADVEHLESFYGHTIVPVISTALYAIVISVFMATFHPVLGLIAFAAYTAVGFVVPFVSAVCSKGTSEHLRHQSGLLSGYLLDSLRGLTETLQYGGSLGRMAEMNKQTDRILKEEKKLRWLEGLSGGLTEVFVIGFELCMVMTAAVFYHKGWIDFTGVLVPCICMLVSFEPCLELAGMGSKLSKTLASGKRILDLLDESPTAPEIEGETDVTFRGVQVENVTVTSEGYPVLQAVSLEIPENAIVGLTGPSSSGKSTLLKLLMRFGKPDTGTIRISGTSVEQINTLNLREMESLVTQDTYLFADSLLNNLRVAKTDASMEEIQEACKKAAIHDFILSLPHGYDTQVSELGDSLSDGERQRIGLARAFLHGAPFLLLDEPTRNLDSFHEAVILRSLHHQRKDKTILLVSHRPSALCIADQVYAAERGHILKVR